MRLWGREPEFTDRMGGIRNAEEAAEAVDRLAPDETGGGRYDGSVG
jgi:hypothetical protein